MRVLRACVLCVCVCVCVCVSRAAHCVRTTRIGKFGGMRSTPVKVDVLSQDRVVQVVAGADHSAAVTGKN